MNITFLRNTRKAYIYYVLGFALVFMGGLVVKNFNDKIAVMSSSVHSYQTMVDKQSNQLKAVSMEKDRLKRDLDDNDNNLRELKSSLNKLDVSCKEEREDLDQRLDNSIQKYSILTASNNKLEGKYRTLSKSNADSISTIERLSQENKELRSRLDEANTSKTTQMMKIREELNNASLDREKFKNQYTALFRQQQQSVDSIQLLQDERDQLQEQIREIQRLSGGTANKLADVKGEAAMRTVGRATPSSNQSKVSSSTPRAVMAEPRLIEEPRLEGASSSLSPPQELQGAEPRHIGDSQQQAAPRPKAASRQAPAAASRPPAAVYPGSRGIPIMAAPPPIAPVSQPTINQKNGVLPPGLVQRRQQQPDNQYHQIHQNMLQKNLIGQQNLIQPFIKHQVENVRPAYKDQYNMPKYQQYGLNQQHQQLRQQQPLQHQQQFINQHYRQPQIIEGQEEEVEGEEEEEEVDSLQAPEQPRQNPDVPPRQPYFYNGDGYPNPKLNLERRSRDGMGAMSGFGQNMVQPYRHQGDLRYKQEPWGNQIQNNHGRDF